MARSNVALLAAWVCSARSLAKLTRLSARAYTWRADSASGLVGNVTLAVALGEKIVEAHLRRGDRLGGAGGLRHQLLAGLKRSSSAGISSMVAASHSGALVGLTNGYRKRPTSHRRVVQTGSTHPTARIMEPEFRQWVRQGPAVSPSTPPTKDRSTVLR